MRQQRDDVGRAVGRVGIGIDEGQVATVRIAGLERDVDELVFAALGEEGLAALRTAVEPVLKGADAIEAGAVRVLVDLPAELHRIADLDHRDQTAADVVRR